jgi:hypothetical protein
MMVEEQRDPKAVISRRTLIQGLGVCAGATVVAMSGALAQGSNEVAPPTTITSPPRDFSSACAAMSAAMCGVRATPAVMWAIAA